MKIVGYRTALLWQKEATLENEISRKWEKCVCHVYIDINTKAYNIMMIFQQDERFCSKFGLEVEHAESNPQTSLSQIWVICHLLPLVRVGQRSTLSIPIGAFIDQFLCIFPLPFLNTRLTSPVELPRYSVETSPLTSNCIIHHVHCEYLILAQSHHKTDNKPTTNVHIRGHSR